MKLRVRSRQVRTSQENDLVSAVDTVVAYKRRVSLPYCIEVRLGFVTCFDQENVSGSSVCTTFKSSGEILHTCFSFAFLIIEAWIPTRKKAV